MLINYKKQTTVVDVHNFSIVNKNFLHCSTIKKHACMIVYGCLLC